MLTLLDSVFNKLRVQTQGSLVNHHGDVRPQGLQESTQSNGSWWAICFFWRLVIEMCREPSSDQH
jgi:hypothetical protein